MNDKDLENLCSIEPTQPCPDCGQIALATWVDIGFGPYSQQAGPYSCTECDWVEPCPYVSPEKCDRCVSFDTCYTRLEKK